VNLLRNRVENFGLGVVPVLELLPNGSDLLRIELRVLAGLALAQLLDIGLDLSTKLDRLGREAHGVLGFEGTSWTGRCRFEPLRIPVLARLDLRVFATAGLRGL
jgi:hypothetical protein